MEIHFKSTHSIDEKLQSNATSFAQRKIQSLKKHLGHKDDDAQVYVELGKVSEAHVNGTIWRAHINLDSKGQQFHATVMADKLETAIDRATTEISHELQKTKQRRTSMVRKGGTAVKAWMRGFGQSRHSF